MIVRSPGRWVNDYCKLTFYYNNYCIAMRSPDLYDLSLLLCRMPCHLGRRLHTHTSADGLTRLVSTTHSGVTHITLLPQPGPVLTWTASLLLPTGRVPQKPDSPLQQTIAIQSVVYITCMNHLLCIFTDACSVSR